MAKPWELRWNTGSPARPPRPPLLAAPDSRCSERSLGRPAGATEGRGQGKHASWKPKHSVTAGLGSPPSPLLAHSPALPWPSVPKKPFQSLIITHDTTARAAGLEAAGKTVQKVLCERGNSLMNNRAGRRKSWRLESLFLRRRCFLPTLYLCFLFRFPLFAFNVVSSSSCTSCDFSCSSEVPEGHLIKSPGRCPTVVFFSLFSKLLKLGMVRIDCFCKTLAGGDRAGRRCPGGHGAGENRKLEEGWRAERVQRSPPAHQKETLREKRGINETPSAGLLG